MTDEHAQAHDLFAGLKRIGVDLAARVIPDFAADVVERVGGQLDQVKRVIADVRVRAAFADGPRVIHEASVGRHELDLLVAVFAEQIQELLDGPAVPARTGPHRLHAVVRRISRRRGPADVLI